MGWKFFYKPTTTGIPLIAGTSHKLSDSGRLRELGFGGTVPEIPIINTTTSIWGKVHDMASKTTPGTYVQASHQVTWSAFENYPAGKIFDQYIRIHSLDSGNTNYGITGLSGLGNSGNRYSMSHYISNGNIQHACYDEDGVRTISFANTNTLNQTIGGIYDIIIRHDYTDSLPSVVTYVNGVLGTTVTGGNNFLAADFPFGGQAHGFGANYTFSNTKFFVEHYGIYDGLIPNPTDYVPGGAVDAELLALVGTPTDTDPGIANVRVDTEYVFGGSTLTGTLSVPTANTGAAGTVPINNIKEQIRYVLAENNTSTGAPTLDLSSNLSKRVASVLKLNPEVIPLNNNAIPAVTVFTESKSPIEQTGINCSGLKGKRKAEVNYKIAGMVYAPNYLADKGLDKSDDEVEYLMENIERVLRAYDDLGGTVNWNFPTGVTYHAASFDEDTHFRVGLMDLKVTILY